MDNLNFLETKDINLIHYFLNLNVNDITDRLTWVEGIKNRSYGGFVKLLDDIRFHAFILPVVVTLPFKKKITGENKNINFNKIEINGKNQTIYFKENNVTLFEFNLENDSPIKIEFNLKENEPENELESNELESNKPENEYNELNKTLEEISSNKSNKKVMKGGGNTECNNINSKLDILLINTENIKNKLDNIENKILDEINIEPLPKLPSTDDLPSNYQQHIYVPTNSLKGGSYKKSKNKVKSRFSKKSKLSSKVVI